jgi:class 3 adenylate cyclase
MKKPSTNGLDKYLGFETGTFGHIPHYCVEDAIFAIRKVQHMERHNLFRPGLYYIVLSDLCNSTKASAILGQEINKKRVETFILKCVETLGYMDPRNYFMFLREVGDAVLILFSSFADAHEWWLAMESWLDTQNRLWDLDVEQKDFKYLRLEAKTVIHAGEVGYSSTSIPMALAVNQVFKIEKLFKKRELGITDIVFHAATDVIKSLKLRPRKRHVLTLPEGQKPTTVYLADKFKGRY